MLLAIVFAVVLPLILLHAYKRGGLRLLWSAALVASAALAIVAFQWPEPQFYHRSRLVASGLSTLPWPVIPPILALLAPIALKLPGGVPVALIPLALVALLGACSMSWIA